MGLDMYAFRVRRCKEDEIKRIIETGAVPKGITFIPQKYLRENSEMYSDLEPYLTPITFVDVDRFDLNLLMKENGIPENASIVGRGYDGTYLSFLFSDNGTRKEITITPAELNEKYPNKEPSSGACFGCEEVAYWRKAYGLEDKLYESYPRAIENCGYYKCNEEMLEAMLDYDSEVDDGYMESYDTFTTDDSDIFYHEWY